MSLVSVGIIFLIVVQAIHLYEEVRKDFRRKVPIGEIPKSLFIWLNVAAFAFAIVTLCLCQAENGDWFRLGVDLRDRNGHQWLHPYGDDDTQAGLLSWRCNGTTCFGDGN